MPPKAKATTAAAAAPSPATTATTTTTATTGTGKKETATLQLPPVPEHLLVRHPKRWVSVYFKLMGFSALDGVARLPPDTTLRMLEHKIIAHHGGSIGRLTLWRDRIEPSCVVRDLTLTLKEVFQLDDAAPRQVPGLTLGLAGAGAGPAGGRDYNTTTSAGSTQDHTVLVYYDYRPHETECPLLLRSPRYPSSSFSSAAAGNNAANTNTATNLNATTAGGGGGGDATSGGAVSSATSANMN